MNATNATHKFPLLSTASARERSNFCRGHGPRTAKAVRKANSVWQKPPISIWRCAHMLHQLFKTPPRRKILFWFGARSRGRAIRLPSDTVRRIRDLGCGSAEKVLVLPRPLVLQAMRNVTTRKLDVFAEGDTYVLQTTGHPKINVTEFLNAFPADERAKKHADEIPTTSRSDRAHVKIQNGLIRLGRAEGCSVWVPPNDRNLSYKGESFQSATLDRLPNFGFDENTRRIVQNIDVLWLTRNVIRRGVRSGIHNFNL